MDSFNFNLDLMTKETFDLGQQVSFDHSENSNDFLMDKRHFESNEYEDVSEDQIEITESSEVFPQSFGVIYKIEKASGTFCIRALVSCDISQTFTELYEQNPELLSKLKIGEFVREDFFFYETCSVERAEIIFDNLANRRLPLDEDALCNISDPGFSWWMNVGEGSFQIHFNSHGLNRAERFIKLGPLGDGDIAAMRFSQLEEHLAKHFPISEIFINNKGIKISTAALDNKAFYAFQSMFSDGINDSEYADFNNTSNARTLFLYLKEISDTRSFWLELESKL